MKDLLAVANEHNFAVPAFNVSSNMILKGVMHTCEEMQAPVIIAIHPDELSFVEDSFVKAVIEEAHKATVPVLSLIHICTVSLAELIGSSLPMLAKRLRLDPALVAAPLITTCVDAAAITIYFSIATSLFKL